jgi:hypothetical protein
MKSPMGKSIILKTHVRHLVIMIALPFLLTQIVRSQDAPLISGATGFVTTTSAGQTFVQPVIAPVAVVPLGEHWLFESRADLRGLVIRGPGNGPYEGQFFATLEYAQLDYLVNKRLTISVGRYLTPFNTYDERLTAIWIRDLPDAPLLFTVGTRTSGSSNGAMIRGVAANTDSWEWNYTAYFSAASTIEQASSGRAAGFRSGVFLPHQQLEVGGSYQRFLQDTHQNIAGAYLWWVPVDVPVQIRSEYAHSPQAHGYWVEGAFRLTRANTLTSVASRIQPVVRVQRFVQQRPGFSALSGSSDTKAADFGLNVYLPRDVRVSSSYSRQFSSQGDFNVWNVDLTYRFVLPLAGRRQ